ncbi:MAG TPA: hypothetical protein VL088_15715 [Pedobacter sp.]|nr:hypothetical protein [Pedobacter sp.]
MYFSLRLRSESDEMQPVHIKSKEIDERFFPFPKFKRKDEIQKLIDSGELITTTEKGFSKDGKEYNKYYYMALKGGGFDLNLMDTKNIPEDPVTQTMLRNIQLVSLSQDALSTDYFNLFLKYQTTHHRVFFTVDKFAGRVHTPISNFHRTHRPNILIENEQTTSLDVTTMQPLLLGKVLFTAIGKNDFTDWINAGKDIYLMLQDKANLSTRDEAKKKFFEILFNKPDNLLQELFGSSNWITWINQYKSKEIKENPNLKFNKDGTRSHHNNLAWRLQTDEVTIMRKIWTALVELNIPFLSVHDEIIIKKKDLDQTYTIMTAILSKEFEYFKISGKLEPQTNDILLIERFPLKQLDTLKTLLNEIIEKVPTNIPAIIDNESYPCFKTVVQMILKGWEYDPDSKYFQDRIREIYHIMHLNGFIQFANKY